MMLEAPSGADLVGADIYWGALQPQTNVTNVTNGIMSLINLRKAWINSVEPYVTPLDLPNVTLNCYPGGGSHTDTFTQHLEGVTWDILSETHKIGT